MAIARKTYVFRGAMAGTDPSKWEFELRYVFNSLGRPEPYDPAEMGDDTESFQWNFQTQGSRGYAVSQVTVDGNVVWTQGQQNSDIVTAREDRIGSGYYSITFDTSNFLITENSTVLLYIKQNGVYTPWIPYNEDYGIFNRQAGLIDMDGALPEGVASIKISQDIDMQGADYQLGIPIIPTLVGLLVGTGVNQNLLAAMFGDYTGIGTVRVIYNNNALGSSTAKIINGQSVFDPALAESVNPVPLAQFRYKMKILPNVVVPDLLNGINLVTTGGYLIETTEYFCLKYEDMTLAKLIEYCCYPWLPYVDALSPYQDPEDDASQTQRTDSQGQPIDVPTDYRHELTDDDVYWFDRIRQLSYLPNQQGPSPFPYPAPAEYPEATYTEFNELNNRMRLNRPVRTKLSFSRYVGYPSDVIKTPESTYGIGLYEVDTSAVGSAPQELQDQFTTANFAFAQVWNDVKLHVYVEDNGCVDISTAIPLNQQVTVMGKLINLAWFQKHKGIMTDSPITEESALFEWTGVSKSTWDYLSEVFAEETGHNVWVIIVRGRGDVHAPAEIILKDAFYDCLVTKSERTEIGPGSEIVLSADGIPLFNLDFIPATGTSIPAASPVVVEYKDENDQWLELTRDILFPGRSGLEYNHDKAMTASCIKSGEIYRFNYPIFGSSEQMVMGTGTIETPKMEIPVTVTPSTNGLPFSSPVYIFYVLKDGIRIPYGQWTEVIEGDNLVGITISSPDEESHYQLSMLNASNATTRIRTLPSSTKRAKAIRVSGLPGKFLMFVNNFASGDVLSLEPVGYVRRTDRGSNDIYYELVPGRGLKTREAGTSGHGVNFEPYDWGSSAAMSGRIQGLVNYPWFYIDPYRENTYAPKSADSNGIEKLDNGSEIAAETSVYFGNSQSRALLFYTLLEKYQPPKLKDVIIAAAYDEVRHEGIMAYTRTDGRFHYVQGMNDFANKWELRQSYPVAQVPGKRPGIEAQVAQYDVYRLGADSIEKSKRIIHTMEPSPVVASSVSVGAGTLQAQFQAGEDTQFLGSVSIRFTGIPEKLVANKTDWSNCICFKIEYTTRGDSELRAVGWEYGNGGVATNYYSTHLASVINIPVGFIQDPDKVIVSIVDPPEASDSELEANRALAARVSFVNILTGNFYVEADMQEGTAGCLWRDSQGKTNFIFDSGRLYGNDGKPLEKNPSAPVLTQMVTSRNNGDFWLHPGLEYGDVIERTDELVQLEGQLLNSYGLSPDDAAKIALKTVSHNVPKVVTTFQMPNMVPDKANGLTYIFGYEQNGLDATRGDLVCWRLDDSIIGRSDFSFLRLEEEAAHSGGMTAESRTVATIVPYQTPCAVLANDGTLVALWHDDNAEINMAVSKDSGVSWDRSPLRLGRLGSAFGRTICARACISEDSTTLHVFGLRAIGDYSSHEAMQGASQFHLITMTVPMQNLYVNSPEAIEPLQAQIDAIEPVFIVPGAANTHFHLGPSGRPVQAPADEPIGLAHYIGCYYDVMGKLRVVYMKDERLVCKVSIDRGQTWRLDQFF